ncbi:response regulator transcription factor [Terriglobus aquaticus]|uniref:DNA-binding response regulator n=1 Tax=Terriglobus aquaticus TaxID=940139 RepID=A0ABW9KND4_9BACT|nr:response regulator transcription factor [Terriglobus aquaticus]
MSATLERLRIGVILADPLRFEGLVALFGDTADLLPMLPTDAVRRSDLSLLILEASEELFALLAAFRRARAGLRILVLGESADPAYISRVVAAGAKGYMPRNATVAEMQMAIQVVADGSIWAPRKVLAGLIDTLSTTEPVRQRVQFTPREREVLQLLVLGSPDRDIAGALGLSVRTVQGMVRALLKRVGVSNRVALTVYVMEKHLIS